MVDWFVQDRFKMMVSVYECICIYQHLFEGREGSLTGIDAAWDVVREATNKEDPGLILGLDTTPSSRLEWS